jgi:hypothetical protein
MWKIILQPKWYLFHVVSGLGVLVCIRLGIWQWVRRERVNPVTGDIIVNLQSTFYAFQWIFFAIAVIWFWFKFFKDEDLVSRGLLKKGDEDE